MTEQNFDALRRIMVASQLRTTGVNDARVIAAMAEVPRERFVPGEQAHFAYCDRGVPIGNGRVLPSPEVLGRLLTEVRVSPRDTVLVVGAGTGYAAAVAALLARRIVALEEDAGLAAGPLAASVERVRGPLAEGWPAGAPYDVILFDGAVETVPDAIVAQLAEGGRLAVPLLVKGVPRLSVGRKAGGGFGLASVVDAAAPVLPGFARPAAFAF